VKKPPRVSAWPMLMIAASQFLAKYIKDQVAHIVVKIIDSFVKQYPALFV
jgi:hypothetical protein